MTNQIALPTGLNPNLCQAATTTTYSEELQRALKAQTGYCHN